MVNGGSYAVLMLRRSHGWLGHPVPPNPSFFVVYSLSLKAKIARAFTGPNVITKALFTMPWDYTADKSRRVAAAQAGWKLDAKMGYVFTTSQSDTVPIWQHFSPTSKDAIYARSVDTIALQSGYELSKTPAWHMYEHQKPGTVPLYRFCKDNFNFFGDDESIKLGKTEGWKNWAIVGYYYKEHQPGTSVLLRWDTEPYFQLLYNNTVLRASSYSEVDGYMKYSHLSLDYILQFQMGALEIVPAPDNLQEPDNEHMIPGVFSQQVVQTNKCDFRHNGGARFWALTDFVSPSTAREVDLEPHLRRLEDGHIVFLHP